MYEPVEQSPPEPPAAVRALVDGRPYRLVWRNELGGLTWEVPGSLFVKWQPRRNGVDLSVEAEKLRWAGAFTPVPPVVAAGGDETATWLATRPLPGLSAVAPRWLAEPRTAVVAIGEGLRAMHDALPVEQCPYDWSAPMRVAETVAAGGFGRAPGEWHAEHQSLTLDEALAAIAEPPPVDRPVVCHADPCSPNTLLDDDGRWLGHVDLGRLGVADRWADLAVATWSTVWNYGPGWERTLLDAYGIAPDAERTAYYRLLWDLGP